MGCVRRLPHAVSTAGGESAAAIIGAMSLAPVDPVNLAVICGRFGVRRRQLFGSATEPGTPADRDVDLLVEFIPGQAPGAFALVDLQDELSALFGGRPVDLAFASILRNPYRKRAIEPQWRPLFG